MALTNTEEAARIAVLEDRIEDVVLANMDFLRRHPATPALYDSGIRYQADPEPLRTRPIEEALELGWGDCDTLAAIRAAELRMFAPPKQRHAIVRLERASDWTPEDLSYHALVARRIGYEDPAAYLIARVRSCG